MSIYDTLNPMQKEAVLHTEGHSPYSGGSRFREDPGTDPPDCIPDRGKRGQSLECPGYYLYE